MAFVVSQFRPDQPGNIVHFWNVTCLDADVTSDWVATGFQAAVQDLDCFTVNGTAVKYTGEYRIERNAAPVVIAGVTYEAGLAWRLVKNNAVGSGGTVRVRAAVYPGAFGV